MRWLIYYPKIDCINNCGCYQEIDDFKPGAFGCDPEKDAANFEAATRHLPTSAGEVVGDPNDPERWIALGVPCQDGLGITYAALREAASAARTKLGLAP